MTSSLHLVDAESPIPPRMHTRRGENRREARRATRARREAEAAPRAALPHPPPRPLAARTPQCVRRRRARGRPRRRRRWIRATAAGHFQAEVVEFETQIECRPGRASEGARGSDGGVPASARARLSTPWLRCNPLAPAGPPAAGPPPSGAASSRSCRPNRRRSAVAPSCSVASRSVASFASRRRQSAVHSRADCCLSDRVAGVSSQTALCSRRLFAGSDASCDGGRGAPPRRCDSALLRRPSAAAGAGGMAGAHPAPGSGGVCGASSGASSASVPRDGTACAGKHDGIAPQAGWEAACWADASPSLPGHLRRWVAAAAARATIERASSRDTSCREQQEVSERAREWHPSAAVGQSVRNH